jgi:hypothetical protein
MCGENAEFKCEFLKDFISFPLIYIRPLTDGIGVQRRRRNKRVQAFLPAEKLC